MMVVPAPGAERQISRGVLALLIIGALISVLPHLMRLWGWLWVVGAVAIGWSTMVQLGRWQPPSGWIKGGLALAGFVGVWTSSRNIAGLDATVGLLLVAYQLKIIETQRQRDGFVVVFMAYFVIATWFLFDQTIASAVWGFVASVVATAGLVAQNQSLTKVRPWAAVRMAAVLAVLAAPLAGGVFLLFPRVAPLWLVAMPTSARSGLSDRVNPGSIVSLSRDSSVAFRAIFEGRMPRPEALYWRALNYYAYDNAEWRQGSPTGVMPDELVDWNDAPQRQPWALQGPPVLRYQVVMEPTDRPWLFSIGDARALEPRIGTLRDRRLIARQPVGTTFAYRVVAAAGGGDLPEWMRDTALQLPTTGNPRSRRLAAYLRAQNTTDTGFANAIMKYFRERGFSYTLAPGAMSPRNSIDVFMFDARRGFCSHYATAMVYLLRVGGVPSRLVGGYLGGDVNASGGFMTVRQYHAHAWVEAWLDGRGWTRLDPTEVVAPGRISRGVEGISAAAAGEALEPWALRGVTGFASLFAGLDSVEHRWNMWVVGYDAGTQQDMLGEWFGASSWRRVGLLMLGIVGIALLAYLLAVQGAQWRRDWRMFTPARGLERWGARQGIPRPAQETLADYGVRLAALRPTHASRIEAFVQASYALLYAPHPPSSRQLWRLWWRLHLPGSPA